MEQNFALRRKIGVYRFPSLVLAQGEALFPIEMDYQTYKISLDAIKARIVL
jgi:hypothetical protein